MPDCRLSVCVASQFAMACNLACVYDLMSLEKGLTGGFFPLSMLLYAPLIYLLDLLLLRRNPTVLVLSTLNFLCAGAMLLGRLLLEPWRGFADLAFAAAFLIWLTMRAGQFAREGAPLRGTLLMLDCSFLLLIAITAAFSASLLPLARAVPALCGLSASMVTASASRSPKTAGAKGWLALGIAFALLMVPMWFFLTVLATPAASGLVSVWRVITSGIRAVGQCFLGLLGYLLSLFPGASLGEPGSYEVPELPALDDSPIPEVSPIVGAVLLILLALCAAALLVWLIRTLGRSRVGRTAPMKSAPPPRRERTGFGQGLLRLLSSLIRAVELRWRLWQNRDTALGLYFLLEHRCRRSPWRKVPGETPREFLLRMAEAARPDDALRRALTELARQTDAALYSNRPPQSRAEGAALIRRRMGAAVRRQYWNRLRTRLKAKPSART